MNPPVLAKRWMLSAVLGCGLCASGLALASLSVSKSYSPSSITAGNSATLTITLTVSPPTPGGSGTVAFTDNYAAGVVNSSTPSSNTCGGTASGTIGGSSLALSGGGPLNGNDTCSVKISVTACTAGTYTDNVSVTATNTNDPTSANASLTVTGSATTPSASLSTVSTSASSVAADGSSYATITVTAKTACNTAASGKTVTLSAGSGSSTITTVSGTTDANGEASFTVKNSVAEGPITYTAVAGGTTLSETTAVTFTPLTAPSVAKSFSPATINTGASSTLSIDLVNPNAAAINALAFTDSFPSGLVVAGTPALANSCGGTASYTSGSLSLSGGTLGGSSSCTVSVMVTASTPASYPNSTGAVTSSNADPGTTASATLTVQSGVADFNAVETGANAVSGHLYTKLVGTGFDFDLVALDSGNALATGFTGTVAVELVDAGSSGSCAGMSQIADLGNQDFVAGDAGRHPYSPSVNVASAHASVKVRISYPDQAIVACSGDSFTIRPTALSLSSTDANADNAGSSPTATPILAAGATFTLSAAGGSGYTGTPSISLGSVSAHSGANQVGSLAGSFGAASGGTASGSFTYSEVGYFRLNTQAVYDDSFTAADNANGDCVASSFSNTVNGSGQYGCNFGTDAASSYFGRFVPDHFDVLVTDACTTFSYSGQPFSVQVIARNSGSTDTANYAGSYAKTVTLSRASGSGGSFSNNTLAATAFALGVATTATPEFAFDSAPDKPLDLDVRATDSEGVSSATGTEGDTEIRSGRLRMSSAFGSGQAALSLPIRIESWQNLKTAPDELYAWDVETEDTCTTLASGDFTVSGVATTVTAVTLSTGVGSLSLSAPGAAGSADIAAALGSVADWLQFDWNGDGTADDPSARVGFELNPGNRRQIYTREVIGN